MMHTHQWLGLYLSVRVKCGTHTLLKASPHQKMYSIVLLRRWVSGSRWDPATKRWNKSSGNCIDVSHWLALTDHHIYLYQYYMTPSVRGHPWIFDTSSTRAHNLTIVPLPGAYAGILKGVSTASKWLLN